MVRKGWGVGLLVFSLGFATPVVSAQETLHSILQLQIALDRKNFSPGCITGTLNGQTRQAVAAFQKSLGLVSNGIPDENVKRRLRVSDMELITHVVSRVEENSLMTLPKTWPEKSKMQRLGFESVAELVAEKYHASVDLLRKINPFVPWPNPPAGTHLKVPKVSPSKRVYAKRLEVSLGNKEVRAYDSKGDLIAYFPCSIAEKIEKRPRGSVRIKNAADNPSYTFDPEIFPDLTIEEKGTRRRLIPPGPNNPVGVAWIGLSISGYGLHGTPDPENIGKTGSKGCFRLANWNAKKLINMVQIGIPVEIE